MTPARSRAWCGFAADEGDSMADALGSGKSAAAVDFLRARIASGEWAVISRIPREPELMELMGVGKSTVREAVRSLAGIGMLEPIRGVGTFVRSRTPVNTVVASSIGAYGVEDVLGFRAALEIEAARQAALHRTDEQAERLRMLLSDAHNAGAETSLPRAHGQAPGGFHQQIVEASGNLLLRDLYVAAIAAIRDKRGAGLIQDDDRAELRREDHARIALAIEQGDAAAAADAMARHVARDIAARGGGPAAQIS
jgi:DNA-binding FadR family transcriptional regulator